MLLQDLIYFDIEREQMQEYLLDYGAAPIQRNQDVILKNLVAQKTEHFLVNFAAEHAMLQTDFYSKTHITPAQFTTLAELDRQADCGDTRPLLINPWENILATQILPKVQDEGHVSRMGGYHCWFTISNVTEFHRLIKLVDMKELLRITIREVQKKTAYILSPTTPAYWFNSKLDLRTEKGFLWFDLNGLSFPLSLYFDLHQLINYYSEHGQPLHLFDRTVEAVWFVSRRSTFSSFIERNYGLTGF